jgi:hypothetical protein
MTWEPWFQSLFAHTIEFRFLEGKMNLGDDSKSSCTTQMKPVCIAIFSSSLAFHPTFQIKPLQPRRFGHIALYNSITDSNALHVDTVMTST